MENNPKVSISITTYNHGQFLRQCLDGVFIQNLQGGFEVLIHDDASSDNTQEIIDEYIRKYPGVIFPLIQVQNQYSKGVRGMMPRFNFPRARGKYIALCEGDDYWTDPNKLQRQVDFLEANPEYSFCFHPVSILMPNDELKQDFITQPPNAELDIATIARYGNFIHTPSMLFRNAIDSYPETFLEAPLGDYPLQMLLAEKGKCKMIPQSMAVYRYGVGVWSSAERAKRSLRTARTHVLLASYFLKKGNTTIGTIFLERIAKYLSANANQCSSENLNYLFNDFSHTNDLLSHMVNALEAKNQLVDNLKRNQVEATSSANMLRVIIHRVFKKLFRKV